MIDGSEKRNCQLPFELHNSHVCEKCSNWSCCNNCDADDLERLQRRAAKIVFMSSSSDIAMLILKWYL